MNWLHPLTRNAVYQAASPEERRSGSSTNRGVVRNVTIATETDARGIWPLLRSSRTKIWHRTGRNGRPRTRRHGPLTSRRPVRSFNPNHAVAAQQSEWTVEAARCAWLAGQTDRALTARSHVTQPRRLRHAVASRDRWMPNSQRCTVDSTSTSPSSSPSAGGVRARSDRKTPSNC